MDGKGRRAIHVVASVLAVTPVLLGPRSVALPVLGAAVVCAVVVEVWRRRGRFRATFFALFGDMLKPREREGISGATWLAVAFFVVALLFPPRIAATAILFGGLGDPAASYAGRRWGRGAPGGDGKSWQGFMGGFLVDGAVGLAMPGIGVLAALVGALAAALAEALPLPLDDNFRTTLAGGVALWAVTAATAALG